ncbi:MAG: hypothetical protein C4547_00770 [Phycisphaerales bacterium]|nr:MAG: hypothetical protein C4547_00770 [Phycisphaerales bacterium]
MRCRKAQRILSAGLDGEVSGRRSKAAGEHAQSCSACAAFAHDLARLGGALQAFRSPAPSDGFTRRVMARLPRRQSGLDILQSWLELLRPAPLGVGVAAFCLGVGLVLLTGGDSASADTGDDALTGWTREYQEILAEVSMEERMLTLSTINGGDDHAPLAP